MSSSSNWLHPTTAVCPTASNVCDASAHCYSTNMFRHGNYAQLTAAIEIPRRRQIGNWVSYTRDGLARADGFDSAAANDWDSRNEVNRLKGRCAAGRSGLINCLLIASVEKGFLFCVEISFDTFAAMLVLTRCSDGWLCIQNSDWVDSAFFFFSIYMFTIAK